MKKEEKQKLEEMLAKDETFQQRLLGSEVYNWVDMSRKIMERHLGYLGNTRIGYEVGYSLLNRHHGKSMIKIHPIIVATMPGKEKPVVHNTQLNIFYCPSCGYMTDDRTD